MEKRCIIAAGAPPAVGPYSHAVAAGDLLFVSGQCPFARDGSGAVHGTIEEETTLALENLKLILEASGSGLEHVVKTTCFLKDMGNFSRFNEIYKKYFTERHPARTTISPARLPLDVQVEVEAIAVIPRR